MLIAKSHPGGSHRWIEQMPYIFRASGPETPDFSAVTEAVAGLMPPRMKLRYLTEDYAAMTHIEDINNDFSQMRVLPYDDGRIIVKYRFAGGRAIVTSSTLEPPDK